LHSPAPPTSLGPLAARRRPLSCCRNAQIGILGVVTLVLLRLTIGWHILYEGLWKLDQKEFSSEGFLSQTSGPLAEHFRYEVITDYEGRDRLSIAKNHEWMSDYHQRFVDQFQPDEASKASAQRMLDTRKANVKSYLENVENKLLIDRNQLGWDQLRARKEARRKGKSGVPYEDKGIYEAGQTLRADIAPALAWTKEQREGLKADLQSLLPVERRDEEISQSFREKLKDRDLMVTYACIAIGFCLMVGLFTRLSALGGALFLAMIVASRWEWPGYYAPPAHPAQGHSLYITKEFIEMMCCFVLATLPVGRWGGLDFIIHNLLIRPFLVKKD
jgi:uncharacterized membrane protein YphA (DoxX/SURF4 family)